MGDFKDPRQRRNRHLAAIAESRQKKPGPRGNAIHLRGIAGLVCLCEQAEIRFSACFFHDDDTDRQRSGSIGAIAVD
jgi:hypothetical protein